MITIRCVIVLGKIQLATEIDGEGFKGTRDREKDNNSNQSVIIQIILILLRTSRSPLSILKYEYVFLKLQPG